MTMSIHEVSDRFEINDLLIDYGSAVDDKNFDAFDELFTMDALIDYTATGGIKGTLSEIKAYLSKALPMFPVYQHMMCNSQVWPDGDKARAKTMCHNPMVMRNADGDTQVAWFGIWYLDELVRTKQGWRIAKRVIESSYVHNMPQGFVPVKP